MHVDQDSSPSRAPAPARRRGHGHRPAPAREALQRPRERARAQCVAARPVDLESRPPSMSAARAEICCARPRRSSSRRASASKTSFSRTTTPTWSDSSCAQGASTHPLAEFTRLLGSHRLVQAPTGGRTPGSSRLPLFNRQTLARQLPGTRNRVRPPARAGGSASSHSAQPERRLARRGLSRLRRPYGRRRIRDRPCGARDAGWGPHDGDDVRGGSVVALPPSPGVRRADRARVGGRARRSRTGHRLVAHSPASFLR
jgi:hypothetical protein